MAMAQERTLKTRQDHQQTTSLPSASEKPSLSLDRSQDIAKLESKIAEYDRELLQYQRVSKQKHPYRVQKKLKQSAMQILRRKRQAVQQKEQLETFQTNAEILDCQLSMTQSTFQTVAAIRNARDEIQKTNVSIHEVDDMALDLQDFMENLSYVDAAMGDLYGVPDIDETDLEAEFLLLEDEFDENGGFGGTELPVAPQTAPAKPVNEPTARPANDGRNDAFMATEPMTSRNSDSQIGSNGSNHSLEFVAARQSLQDDCTSDFHPLPPPTNPARIEDASAQHVTNKTVDETTLHERLRRLTAGVNTEMTSSNSHQRATDDERPPGSFCFALGGPPTATHTPCDIGSIQGIPEESIATISAQSSTAKAATNSFSQSSVTNPSDSGDTDQSLAQSNSSLFRPSQYPRSITSGCTSQRTERRSETDVSVSGTTYPPSIVSGSHADAQLYDRKTSIATPVMQLRGVNPSLATHSHGDQDSRWEDSSLPGVVVTTREQPLDDIDEESTWTDYGNNHTVASQACGNSNFASLERCTSASSSLKTPDSTRSVHVHLHLPAAPSGSPRIRTRSADSSVVVETQVWLNNSENVSSSASTKSWNNTTIDRRPDDISVTNKSVRSFSSEATPEIMRRGEKAVTGLTPLPPNVANDKHLTYRLFSLPKFLTNSSGR